MFVRVRWRVLLKLLLVDTIFPSNTVLSITCPWWTKTPLGFCIFCQSERERERCIRQFIALFESCRFFLAIWHLSFKWKIIYGVYIYIYYVFFRIMDSIMYSISIFVVQDFDHACMAKDEGIFSFFDLSWQLGEWGLVESIRLWGIRVKYEGNICSNDPP